MTYVIARTGAFVAPGDFPPAPHMGCGETRSAQGDIMRPTSRRIARTGSPLTLAALALAACSPDAAPTAPALSVAEASAVAPIWADSVQGTTEAGALYKILRPATWNGEAVFYAHGIRDAVQPIALGETQDRFNEIRDSLGVRGYAVAYSSWAENGYAVKNGVQSTRQLRGLLADSYGQPSRAYLMGHSLGGLVVQTIAEQHPNGFDGALPMCAVLGGSAREVQYIGNVRAVFDALFPGALPGNAGGIPAPGLTPAQVQAAVLGAIFGRPDGQARLAVIANLEQTQLPGTPGAQWVESLVTALAFHARGVGDLTDRAHGHLPFDNANVQYTALPTMPAPLLPLVGLVNLGVQRFEITPDAAKFLEKYYLPTGDLQMPTMTLHNRSDPTVPFFHETAFAVAVAAAGKGALLQQRTSATPYGHCRFDTNEALSAFDALAAWVEGGQP